MQKVWPKFLASPKFRSAIAIVAFVLLIPITLAYVRAPQVSSITQQLNEVVAEQSSEQPKAVSADYILCRTNIRQENKLSPELNALLDSYNQLNDDGKATLRLYLDFLLSNADYKK